MIRKYRNQKTQTTPWHREEEPLNHYDIVYFLLVCLLALHIRFLDSRLKGCGFKPHRPHCAMSLNKTFSKAAKSQDCAIPDISMKLSTLVKVGELMIFRYRTTSTNFLCACTWQNSLPVIENLVSLDYKDQYLRLTW